MKRKTEEKLSKFINCNQYEFEDIVTEEFTFHMTAEKQNAQNLGEIRNLLLLKIKEKEQDLEMFKKILQEKKVSAEKINENIFYSEELMAIKELRRRWNVINDIFQERKKSRQQKKEIQTI